MLVRCKPGESEWQTYERASVDSEVAQGQVLDWQVAHVSCLKFVLDSGLCLFHGVTVEVFAGAELRVQFACAVEA